MSGASGKHYIGIDIGGSKVALSVADARGHLIDTIGIETPATPDFSADREEIFAAVASLLAKQELTKADLAAIGISCPGPLDLELGTIAFVATTHWRDIPVRAMFEQEYGVPVILENDASCASYGEAHAGAGLGAKSVAYFTVSTGVGGGFVDKGSIFSGSHGLACEFGHITVDPEGPPCDCGGRGCVQLYASGTAIADRIAALIAEGVPSVLSGLETITSREAAEAVRGGDNLAMRVWGQAMRKLGVAAAIIHQVLDPEIIVFGGGVSNNWDLMEQPLLDSIRRNCGSNAFARLKISKAALGSATGTMGAILLARDTLGSRRR